MALERHAAPARLITARLRAEPVGPQHQDVLAALAGDPRVGATLGGARTPEQVAGDVERHADHWKREGFGYWAWFERATGAFVARGGLGRTPAAGDPTDVEVGWVVVPERWGEGFATELGAASLDVAFGPLALPEVIAFTLPRNRASRRVMEKLAFDYDREIPWAGEPHVLYRRSSDASMAAAASG